MPVENKKADSLESPLEPEKKAFFKIRERFSFLNKTFSNRKLLALLIVFCLSLCLLFLIISRGRKSGEEVFLPDQPISSEQEPISSPSAYASDSLVLEIEKNLAAIKKDLLETELDEKQLLPPELNMNVSF